MNCGRGEDNGVLCQLPSIGNRKFRTVVTTSQGRGRREDEGEKKGENSLRGGLGGLRSRGAWQDKGRKRSVKTRRKGRKKREKRSRRLEGSKGSFADS